MSTSSIQGEYEEEGEEDEGEGAIRTDNSVGRKSYFLCHNCGLFSNQMRMDAMVDQLQKVNTDLTPESPPFSCHHHSTPTSDSLNRSTLISQRGREIQLQTESCEEVLLVVISRQMDRWREREGERDVKSSKTV